MTSPGFTPDRGRTQRPVQFLNVTTAAIRVVLLGPPVEQWVHFRPDLGRKGLTFKCGGRRCPHCQVSRLRRIGYAAAAWLVPASNERYRHRILSIPETSLELFDAPGLVGNLLTLRKPDRFGGVFIETIADPPSRTHLPAPFDVRLALLAHWDPRKLMRIAAKKRATPSPDDTAPAPETNADNGPPAVLKFPGRPAAPQARLTGEGGAR